MGDVNGGRYYSFRDGRAVEIQPAQPDTVICRRLEDFPPARVPAGAVIGACRLCGAAIASSPINPYPDVPRICFQCSGVVPLPIPSLS